MTRPQHAGVALQLEAVSRVYGRAGTEVRALDGVDLALPAGSFTAVMGPSGSGKSTLLNCAAGLDRPTGGTVTVAQGRSNAGIAAGLVVTEKAVGKHINNIFVKLGLPMAADDNRRVLAVLQFLQAASARPS